MNKIYHYTEVYQRYTYTNRVTMVVDDCMIFCTFQISNELLTLLTVKPNYWCQKTPSWEWTRAVHEVFEREQVQGCQARKLSYHPVSIIPPVLSSNIPFYSFWLVSPVSFPHSHPPGKQKQHFKKYGVSPLFNVFCVTTQVFSSK